jgi:hypothetical protein
MGKLPMSRMPALGSEGQVNRLGNVRRTVSWEWLAALNPRLKLTDPYMVPCSM